MARIALFPYSASLAHAGRAVTLGRALQLAGHDVTLVGQPHYLESSLLVDRAEFDFAAIHEPDLARVLAPARGRAVEGEEFVFAGAIVDEAEILARIEPDLVVVDNRRSAVVSAEAVGLPTLSLTNSSLLGPWCAIDPTVGELADIAAPAIDAVPERLLGALAKSPRDTPVPINPIPLPEYITELLGGDNAAPRSYVHELCLGTRTLVLDRDGLFPVRNLPASAELVGPLLFDIATKLPRWWDELDEGRPTIYVTFGSTGEATRFEFLVEELAKLDAQVVVATADMLAVVPAGVHSARYLPSAAMMERSDLVVCHGGSLTMYQALQHGTPVLSIPTHLEQAMETIAMVRAGVARSLAKSEVYPESAKLAAAVTSMLGDGTCRDKAQELAGEIDPRAALAACVAAAESLL